ncbi:hypothetical protein HX878_21055 [Pseudomonas veronii]|uniref:hypothetical protein n=1 Tax=Pseudomonas veronii TaxID=76761 RepID=UPI0015A41AC0|nr:hypothetical protein [Pseudomonas veronii]NWD57221.1 hypothetical protein [Pseudomonas veronii]
MSEYLSDGQERSQQIDLQISLIACKALARVCLFDRAMSSLNNSGLKMASYDYEKGFVGGLKVAPVSRDEGRIGRAPAVHAQVIEFFEFGEFSCEAGMLLCGSPTKTTLYEFVGSINAVTCYRCIALMDRWSHDSINSRCTGHAFTRDGITRAVAAKSVLFAAELLDVNHQLLARRGQVNIALSSSDGASDGLESIRTVLTAHDYGSVFERDDGSQGWRLIKPASEAEAALLKRKKGESARGNTAKQGEVRQNHLVRLTLAESVRLKSLGGAAWIRAKIAKTAVPRKKKQFAFDDAGGPLKGFTLRATDKEWEKLLRLGGNAWVRSVIDAELT